MSSLQSLDIAARSATTTRSPDARRRIPEVAKLIDVSSCIGCKACQVACMQWNDLRDEVGHNVGVYDNPADLSAQSWTVMRFSEVEMKRENEGTRLEWLIRKDGCMHCADPGCLKSCPSPGAIVQYSNGIVDFIEENCIGCGNCITGCPFDIPRLSPKDSKVYKCTLCSDRVGVGLEPACVKACPTGAIHFGSKEDMLEYAGERTVDLKARGFAQAGVYDPPGVGGTHVMYVLQHADQPELYSGLPRDPRISAWVTVWKGVAKPIALAAMLGGVLVGFFHYMKVGQIKVPEDELETRDDARADARSAAVDPAQRPVKTRLFRRYADNTRMNHWAVALLFICAGLSGLAIFHPALFPLSMLFGGGPWTRILHPFFGVLMVLGFALLFGQVWRENLWKRRDTEWIRAAPRLIATGDEEHMPPAGKYNAGQKAVFWAFALSLVLLFVTGFAFWQPWFADYFPIPLRRVAVVVHAVSAVVLILSVIAHVYAAIWVKGTMGAMTRGTVTENWARRNHPLWHSEMVAAARRDDEGEVRSKK